MTDLTETPTFDATVHEIATTDPVMGGPGGIANLQAQALANRTQYLKSEADAVVSEVTAARNGKASLDAKIDAMDTATTAVVSEVTAARNGKASLDAKIDAMDTAAASEASARASGDSTNASAISAEAITRAGNDTTISNNLSALAGAALHNTDGSGVNIPDASGGYSASGTDTSKYDKVMLSGVGANDRPRQRAVSDFLTDISGIGGFPPASHGHNLSSIGSGVGTMSLVTGSYFVSAGTQSSLIDLPAMTGKYYFMAQTFGMIPSGVPAPFDASSNYTCKIWRTSILDSTYGINLINNTTHNTIMVYAVLIFG